MNKKTQTTKNFHLDGKITFLIPLEMKKMEKGLSDFIKRNNFVKKQPKLRKMFFEDSFSNDFLRTEIYETKSKPILSDNKEYIYDISLHLHSEKTLILLIQIEFINESIDKVIKLTRFKEPKDFELEDREPINHISVVIEKLMGKENIIAQIFEKQPIYPFRMIYIENISSEGEELLFSNGTEFLRKQPYLIYGLFHADTHWQELIIDEEDLKNSFCENGSNRIIDFPNFGWYYGALILISREVLIFFKPGKKEYLKNHCDLTLVPVVESALVREMILVRFEKELSDHIRKKLTFFERIFPFVNYFRLRKIQQKTIKYYQGIKALAEEKNFRWFTEIDIFREICFVRYIAEVEEDVKRLLEKMESMISNEFMFITQIWLFIITIIAFIPVIIQIIELFK